MILSLFSFCELEDINKLQIKDNLKEINVFIFLDMNIGLCQTDYAFRGPDLFGLESFFLNLMIPVERAAQMPLKFNISIGLT